MSVVHRAFALALTLLAGASAGASDVSATIVDAKGQPLPDAVVYLMSAQPLAIAKPRRVVIDQVDKEFVPRVTVVQTGTAVDFPNHDNIRHQVYSFSPAKTFELKLYSGRPSAPVVFDKSGVAVLGCNIHDHMIAWVISVDTPWFARADERGRARVSAVPAGKYEMLVWHPGMARPVSQGSLDKAGNDPIERSIRITTGAQVGAVAPQADDRRHAHHHDHRAAGS